MGESKLRRVAVVTTTRADYGILRPLIRHLHQEPSIEVQLIVTGTHLSSKHGSTISEIWKDGVAVAASLDIGMSDTTPALLSQSCARLTEQFANFIEHSHPDIVLVLGDRFELLSIAQACVLYGVPLAHVHGGETTEGALDDSIRHAMTKLSHLHFVASPRFADVVVAMGESPSRVHMVGSLGIEELLVSASNPLPAYIGSLINPGEKYVLVTVHPETRGNNDPMTLARSVTSALDLHPDLGVVVTAPNSDPGANEIGDHFQSWSRNRPRTQYVPSLGAAFASILNSAQMIIGNSSSGIIEAPVLGVGTVNVGARQRGRPCADSVLTVEATGDAISNAISTLKSCRFERGRSPYGMGSTASRITEILLSTDFADILSKRHVLP
jgi:UDP-hydrolysing UDP-N-acetyl-D-glucosamine 2-epimerase